MENECLDTLHYLLGINRALLLNFRDFLRISREIFKNRLLRINLIGIFCERFLFLFLTEQKKSDLVTFPQEILNGKLHFFVQCNSTKVGLLTTTQLNSHDIFIPVNTGRSHFNTELTSYFVYDF